MSILLSWHCKLVIVTYKSGRNGLIPFLRLHEASEVLNKYVMAVWSDNFTASFFINSNVTVFVADIEGIQDKVICF